MSASHIRKAKQELKQQAEASGGIIRAEIGSEEWRYLETMVDNGEFERIENDGPFATYRLVNRNIGAAEQKE